MKVILAQPRGFCAGVVRAIEIVEGALGKYGAPVYVRHEIVHNGHVVADLKASGARFVESLAEVPRGALTIFSAHGVSRAVEQEGDPQRNLRCSMRPVRSSPRFMPRAERYVEARAHPDSDRPRRPSRGRRHDRPRSTARCMSSKTRRMWCACVAAHAPIAYVTQTTLSVDDTKAIISAIERRFSNIVGPGTRDICYATQNRQSGRARR